MPLLDLARLLFPETRSEQESQLRCGWHDFRHPQAQHVFYDLRPGWVSEVQQGDIVIAGRNFGIGSSRPVAALMRHLGVTALVAEEFNSLFLRSAINNGLPAVTVPVVRQHVAEGDTVTVDLAASCLVEARCGLTSHRCPRSSSTSSTPAVCSRSWSWTATCPAKWQERRHERAGAHPLRH